MSEDARAYSRGRSLGHCRGWCMIGDKCSAGIVHVALQLGVALDAEDRIVGCPAPERDQSLFAHVPANRVTEVALQLQRIPIAFGNIFAGYSFGCGQKDVRGPQVASLAWQNLQPVVLAKGLAGLEKHFLVSVGSVDSGSDKV